MSVPRLLRLVVSAFLGLVIGCTSPPPPTRVLVVGLDGATWNVARPMLAAGELPHLRTLMARGVSATRAPFVPAEDTAV